MVGKLKWVHKRTTIPLKSILLNFFSKSILFSIPRLQLIKDLFVFSCYTGLSYIDVNLTQDDINYGIDGNLWIIMKREKTSNPLRIPILQNALDLINKYKENL